MIVFIFVLKIRDKKYWVFKPTKKCCYTGKYTFKWDDQKQNKW